MSIYIRFALVCALFLLLSFVSFGDVIYAPAPKEKCIHKELDSVLCPVVVDSACTFDPDGNCPEFRAQRYADQFEPLKESYTPILKDRSNKNPFGDRESVICYDQIECDYNMLNNTCTQSVNRIPKNRFVIRPYSCK